MHAQLILERPASSTVYVFMSCELHGPGSFYQGSHYTIHVYNESIIMYTGGELGILQICHITHFIFDVKVVRMDLLYSGSVHCLTAV